VGTRFAQAHRGATMASVLTATSADGGGMSGR